MKILIIDDHFDTADVLAILLTGHGHECAVAYTGRGGLDLVTKFRPDLVILDIRLPDMSGYEVARRIRCLPGGGDVFILASSGSKVEGDLFNGVELKPFGVDKLQGVLRLCR